MINITGASSISGVNSTYGTQKMGEINAENTKMNNFKDILDSAIEKKDDVALKKACEEFESYFINSMYTQMRKTVNKDDSFMPTGQAEEMFQSMLDEEVSKNTAKAGGIGIAEMMYKQMEKGQSSLGSI